MLKEANQLLDLENGYSNHYSQLHIEKVETKKITIDQAILTKLKELDTKANELLHENHGSGSGAGVEVKGLCDHYCQAYLKNVKMSKTIAKAEIFTRLIEIEIKMNGNIDDIVSGSWKELKAIDDETLFDEIQDKFPTPYNKASKLLRHELGDRYK